MGEPKVPLPALTLPEPGPSQGELGTKLHKAALWREPAPHWPLCHLGKATLMSIPVDTRSCGQEQCVLLETVSHALRRLACVLGQGTVNTLTSTVRPFLVF